MPACDIFCKVIDNFGDAGIAWRLARSLSLEHGWSVRLVIDLPATLAQMVPEVNPAKRSQKALGIEVELWDDVFDAAPQEAADVVIEAFSCFLPERYEAAIAKRFESAAPCKVFALDYLTAEDYAADMHGLNSPHPRYGYPKTFFFPGFTQATGGIIRERDLEKRQAEFAAAHERRSFLASLGAEPDHPFSLFFFTYPTTPVKSFAQSLAKDARPVQLLLAPGAASKTLLEELQRLGAPSHVHAILCPMLPQKDFDKILWSADAALVRGEDSVVRAQLAGVPLIWTLYPQSEQTHLTKMRAFEKLYGARFADGEAHQCWLDLELGLNSGELPSAAWSRWRDHMTENRLAARAWRQYLLGQESQTSRLVRACA
ncbi:MAG TPA: elongation factor P maturation arginine rhamnosyltransferase EarP [Sutterella sp.]|nr:elongation factor P maturation arginine rhamnosyltransferase EarP [Sutterella sp.]